MVWPLENCPIASCATPISEETKRNFTTERKMDTLGMFTGTGDAINVHTVRGRSPVFGFRTCGSRVEQHVPKWIQCEACEVRVWSKWWPIFGRTIALLTLKETFKDMSDSVMAVVTFANDVFFFNNPAWVVSAHPSVGSSPGHDT